jgi:hypothetical protein
MVQRGRFMFKALGMILLSLMFVLNGYASKISGSSWPLSQVKTSLENNYKLLCVAVIDGLNCSNPQSKEDGLLIKEKSSEKNTKLTFKIKGDIRLAFNKKCESEFCGMALVNDLLSSFEKSLNGKCSELHKSWFTLSGEESMTSKCLSLEGNHASFKIISDEQNQYSELFEGSHWYTLGRYLKKVVIKK